MSYVVRQVAARHNYEVTARSITHNANWNKHYLSGAAVEDTGKIMLTDKAKPCNRCQTDKHLHIAIDGLYLRVRCAKCGQLGEIRLSEHYAIDAWDRKMSGNGTIGG